jgi:hypothetical protein
MPLNATTLGTARYNRLNADFNNKTEAELITAYGTLELARKAAMIADSEEIINHFKASGVVPALGLFAPVGGGPVTGAAQIT